MNQQAKQSLSSLDETVTCAYRVGIRFDGSTRHEQRQLEKQANNIVLTLQQQAFNKLLPEKVDQAVELVRENPDWSGKMGAGYLAKELGDRSNIGQVSYNALLNACKGTFDREEKYEQLLALFKEQPAEAMSWLALGRAPYLERLFQYRIKTGYDYARNMVVSARKTVDQLLPAEYRLSKIIPALTNHQLRKAFEEFIPTTIDSLTTLKNEDTITDRQKTFLKKLILIENQADLLIETLKEAIAEWRNPTDTTSRSFWKILKNCSKIFLERLKSTLKNVPYKKKTTYFSIIRNIFVTAMEHYYSFKNVAQCSIVQLLQEQQLLRPETLVSKPYRKKRKQFDKKIPLSLVMGSKYVVGRPGNSKILTTLAKTEGQFDLTFWYPRKKKASIIGTIRLHKSLKRFLNNGARINLLVLEAGPKPAEKVICTIVLTGQRRMFMSTSAVQAIKLPSTLQKTEIVGLDINRIGEYAVVYSQDVSLPESLLYLCNRYNQLTAQLIDLYRLKARAFTTMYVNYSDETVRMHTKRATAIRHVFTKRKNILREIERQIGHLTTAILVQTGAETLAVEELQCSTRNKKGALAKAIASMPDDTNIYVNAILRTEFLTKQRVFLETVNPAYTSSGIHVNCTIEPAGTIKRTSKQYDEAPCSQCSLLVNTHVNAAKVIALKAYQQQIDRNSEPSPLSSHRTHAGDPHLRSPA